MSSWTSLSNCSIYEGITSSSSSLWRSCALQELTGTTESGKFSLVTWAAWNRSGILSLSKWKFIHWLVPSQCTFLAHQHFKTTIHTIKWTVINNSIRITVRFWVPLSGNSLQKQRLHTGINPACAVCSLNNCKKGFPPLWQSLHSLVNLKRIGVWNDFGFHSWGRGGITAKGNLRQRHTQNFIFPPLTPEDQMPPPGVCRQLLPN